MENSCRKKHKPSPKKWILASRYSEFRRNPALVPANAGLFHYAGNCPVRYIDPDGRITAIVNANIEFGKTEKKEIMQWISSGCPTSYNPKIKAVNMDMQDYQNNIENGSKEYFVNNLKMQISPDEQEKYINDEKRIYTKILLVRSKDEKLIKNTNSLIEEARISAQEKYQSLGNDKELSHAEKIKISEDYANEQLEKKLDLLLENIK